MSQKLKIRMIKDHALSAIGRYFDIYEKQIQEAYENGGKEVKMAFAVSVKLVKGGKVGQTTEINFVKTRIKDRADFEYDPDQILFDFER